MPAGVFALLLASLIYTAYGPMARVMNESFSAPVQVAFRAVVGLTVLSILVRVKRLRLDIARAQQRRAVALGVTFALTGLLYTIAVNNTKLTNAIFIFLALGPVASVLLARQLFGERIDSRLMGAIVLTMTGILVITRPTAAVDIGALAAIGAGLLSGFSNIARRWLKDVDWVVVLFYQSAVTVLVGSFVAALDPGEALHDLALAPVLIGVLYAMATITVSALLLYGYSHIDVSTGSLILSTQLIFVVALGWLAYDEVPTPLEWFGCALIAAGSLLVATRLQRKQQPVDTAI